MKRKFVARLIAVLLVGYAFAFLIQYAQSTNLAHYHKLGQSALIAEITAKNQRSFDHSFFSSLYIVGLITAAVEGLTAVIMLAINRISPPLEPPDDESADFRVA